MAFRISRSLLITLKREAAASVNEVCGLLLGRDRKVTAVLPCRNVAPDPRYRFEIDPAALIAAHRAARKGGAPVLGHYHSHPSGSAVPSACDAAAAAPDGALWLILGADGCRGWRAVRDGAVHGRFDPVTLVVAPPCAHPPAPPEERD